MHHQCFEFVAARLPEITPEMSVIEFGSRDVNGNVRSLLGECHYTGVDIVDGPNVDVVCDAAEYLGKADLILCLETLEHAPNYMDIIGNIVESLEEGGRAIITCATTGRGEHSAIDGGPLREGEFYHNVTIDEVEQAVNEAGGHVYLKEIDISVGDLRAEIRVD